MTNTKNLFLLDKVPPKEETLHGEKVPAQRNLDHLTSSMKKIQKMMKNRFTTQPSISLSV